MEAKKDVIEEGKKLLKTTDTGKKALNKGKQLAKDSGAKKLLKEGKALLEDADSGKDLLKKGKKLVKANGGKKLLKDSKKLVKAVGGKGLLKEGKELVNGSGSKGKSIVKALVTGVALGTTLGVMIAPDKGAKTRKKVKRAAENVKDKVQSLAGEIQQKVGKTSKSDLA